MHVPHYNPNALHVHVHIGHCVLTSLSDGGDEDAGEESKGYH